jgi:ferritin
LGWEKGEKSDQKVTGMIHDLYGLAMEENDYVSQVMLHWLIDEHVEEEDNVSQILDTLERIGDTDRGWIMPDRELGQRGAE